MTNPEIVKIWLEKLRSGTTADRARAASELSRWAIRTRGAVRTRGAAHAPSVSEFPEEILAEALESARQALKDESPVVRREVAAALGRWGGEESAALLRDVAAGPGRDPEESVREAAVAALGAIGGATAVSVLIDAAEHDPASSVRYDATGMLAALSQKTSGDVPQDSRGAIRTRGSARTGPELTPHLRIREALERIGRNPSELDHIRRATVPGNKQ